MGSLTTHVLDTATGKPGCGIPIKLYVVTEGRQLVASMVTNDDGRTDLPLLDSVAYQPGTYELEFSVGDYFRKISASHAEPPFLDDVVIRVTLSGEERYHVPLLASPWSYSTYRGS